MSKRLWFVSKRLGLAGLAAAAVTALSGCVVVPARPHYGYYDRGYYDGGGSNVYVRPAPPPRYYPYYRYRGY